MAQAQVATRLLSADEFFAEAPRYGSSELVRGEVVRLAPAGGLHGMVAALVTAKLVPFVRAHELGWVFTSETGFVLATHPDTVRAPDVAFVAAAGVAGEVPPKTFLPAAPDLAVEVVSPSQSAEYVQGKVADYFAAGSRRVWVLYPGLAAVHVHRSAGDVRILRSGDILTDDELLPGFACPVSELFP
jgi:Uma2 family endonuclease